MRIAQMLRQFLRPIYPYLPTTMNRSLCAFRLEFTPQKRVFDFDKPEYGRLARPHINDLSLPNERLRLAKVDVEAQNAGVIDRMSETLGNARHLLVNEHLTNATGKKLCTLGHRLTRDPNSPNGVFLPPRIPQ